ncbi:ThiF family adenylyltransferase [Thiohalorhabdus sp. Cl-TMA]|uniref:ThiF family adenylyltransferase n=1 Tax=Thiohalorhabdus methylotrophus TaxID=3242694 RepID=A0ABV4TWK6_9GAMM
MRAGFRYEQAFCRNLGWVTEWEQQLLRDRTVAIAGLGGVGGSHLVTLTRLGVGGFHLADPDHFELANFNRQAGATMSRLGRDKLGVMTEVARDINPEVRIEGFPEGLTEDNLADFLAGVDLFIDGLDFFVLEIRARAFQRCAALGIPAITAAPLGMGAALLTFLPGGMGFEDYFRLSGKPPERRQVNFLAGLSPRGPHRTYLRDPRQVDFERGRGPSTPMAIDLCAGAAATEALKLFLDRGRVRGAPHYFHFDAYRGRWIRGWLPGGNRNPLQQLRLRAGYRVFSRFARQARRTAPVPGPEARTDLQRMVDRARWAPSGDNQQPWRFELEEPDTLRIYLEEKGEGTVYDFASLPNRMTLGFLLESLRLAASELGRDFRWSSRPLSGGALMVEAEAPKEASVAPDPLAPFLPVRSVDRRAHRRFPLGADLQTELASCLGEEFEVRWLAAPGERWEVARIQALATDIRLRIPEAFRVHQAVLDWTEANSADGIPAHSVGLDPLTAALMRWALGGWRRMRWMSRLPGSTLIPRLEMDLIPGLFTGAHFLVLRRHSSGNGRAETEQLLRLGADLQRLWLTATRSGLVLHPNLAPLCFAHYGRHGTVFTEDSRAPARARALADRVQALAPDRDPDSVVFLGRIGWPRRRTAPGRSVRHAWWELVRPQSD